MGLGEEPSSARRLNQPVIFLQDFAQLVVRDADARVGDDEAGQAVVALDGEVRWGPWRIESELPGLKVRSWRPGDRLAGRRKKVQDVFVDAKIPRSEREAWPLVVRGDEVVAVPGIVAAPGIEAERAGGRA